ncbi:hypothetical protein HDV57DRAFT_310141 [Trichoderma longibrachiatum]
MVIRPLRPSALFGHRHDLCGNLVRQALLSGLVVTHTLHHVHPSLPEAVLLNTVVSFRLGMIWSSVFAGCFGLVFCLLMCGDTMLGLVLVRMPPHPD